VGSTSTYISLVRNCPLRLVSCGIHNLEVAGGTIDLLLKRQEHDVGVNVIRREGNIQVMVIK